jgi:hypothetical protein
MSLVQFEGFQEALLLKGLLGFRRVPVQFEKFTNTQIEVHAIMGAVALQCARLKHTIRLL